MFLPAVPSPQPGLLHTTTRPAPSRTGSLPAKHPRVTSHIPEDQVQSLPTSAPHLFATFLLLRAFWPHGLLPTEPSHRQPAAFFGKCSPFLHQARSQLLLYCFQEALPMPWNKIQSFVCHHLPHHLHVPHSSLIHKIRSFPAQCSGHAGSTQ